MAEQKTATIDDVIIESVKNSGDTKGAVYNLDISEYPHVAFFVREAGITGTAHFHEGKDPSNDPQILFMIAGRMELHLEDRRGECRTVEVTSGDLVVIPTEILHWYVTVTPVTFAEWRQKMYSDSLADTFSKEIWEKKT